MKSHLSPFSLLFRQPFQLAHGTRTGSEALFLAIEKDGFTGYAEATFPPYVHETVKHTSEQLSGIDWLVFELPAHSDKTLAQMVDSFDLTPFTRALVFNSLADLSAKMQHKSLQHFLGVPKENESYKTTFTLTKSDLPVLASKLKDASPFTHLKLKLDGHHDIDFVQAVRKQTKKPFCADANQGWENMPFETACITAEKLKTLGCELLEQPFLKSNYNRHYDLKKKGIISIFADESIQNARDLRNYENCFDGVNIKILKCGGIDHAFKTVKKAIELEKQIVIGCMSESSCGCATAFNLANLADYLDIDGPWLISNDPFEGFGIKNGKFETIYPEGIGVKPRHELF